MDWKKYSLIVALFVCLGAIFVYANGFDSVSVISPEQDQNYSGDVLLNATVSGNDQLHNASNVTFYFYNSTSGSLVYNVTIYPDNPNINETFNATGNSAVILPDGFYNLTVNATNATDGSFEIENSSITNIGIDNTNPIVSAFNEPVDEANISGDLQVFNVTVTDSTVGLSSVLINITNGSTQIQLDTTNIGDNWNATYNMSLLTEGNHTLIVIANDTLNNVNSTENISFLVDYTSPTVNITNESFSGTDTTPTVSYNLTENLYGEVSCELFMGGSSRSTNATTLNVTLTDLTPSSALSAAVYETQVNCTDSAGNVGASNIINVTVTATSSSSSSRSSGSSGGGGKSGKNCPSGYYQSSGTCVPRGCPSGYSLVSGSCVENEDVEEIRLPSSNTETDSSLEEQESESSSVGQTEVVEETVDTNSDVSEDESTFEEDSSNAKVKWGKVLLVVFLLALLVYLGHLYSFSKVNKTTKKRKK